MSLSDGLAGLAFALFLLILPLTLIYFVKMHRLSRILAGECPGLFQEIRRKSSVEISAPVVAYKLMMEPGYEGERGRLSQASSQAMRSAKTLLYVTASIFMVQLFVWLFVAVNK